MYTKIKECKKRGDFMTWDFSHNGPNQQFGWRPRRGGEWHYGRDYGTQGKSDVPLGVPSYCDGWVCQIVENNKIDGLGNQVLLFSPDGREMVRFAHIETGTMKHLKTGQILRTGDWIGNIAGTGNSENSYQPHIHVEHGRNPKYELIQIEHNNKMYQYRMWLCGNHEIGDYQDPNLKALPFSELEGLTDMAYQSRQIVLSGRQRAVKMSRYYPKDLVKIRPQKSVSFIKWFKSTWLGRIFFSDDIPSQPKRTGPIIHRSNIPSKMDNQKPIQQIPSSRQEINSEGVKSKNAKRKNVDLTSKSKERKGLKRLLTDSSQSVLRQDIDNLEVQGQELSELMGKYSIGRKR